MDATYDTFITLLAATRRLTAAQQRSLKAAAPAGFRLLDLYRSYVPTAERFAREHSTQGMWTTLAPVGEWLVENVW